MRRVQRLLIKLFIRHRDSIFALERAIEHSKASVPSNRKIVIRAKIVKLARLVGDKEDTLAQELKFIKICDDECKANYRTLITRALNFFRSIWRKP